MTHVISSLIVGVTYDHLTAQALEPEAATLARKKRVAEALSTYKKNAGLEVDPASEAAAQEAYNRGMELMQRVRGCTTMLLKTLEHAWAGAKHDIRVLCSVVWRSSEVQCMTCNCKFSRDSSPQLLSHLMRPSASSPSGLV